MVLSKIFCIFEINNDANTYFIYNSTNQLNYKAMLHSLWTLIGVIVLIAVILVAAFYITRTVLFIKYGWASKFTFMLIKFETADKKEKYAIAYTIGEECYRPRFHDFATEEDAKKNADSIVDFVNKYNTEKEIIKASHRTDLDRIIEITMLKFVPNWVLKIMNFHICASKAK